MASSCEAIDEQQHTCCEDEHHQPVEVIESAEGEQADSVAPGETESLIELSPLSSTHQDSGSGQLDESQLSELGRTRGGAVRVSRLKIRNQKDKRIYLDFSTGLPVRPPTSFGLFKHAYRRRFKGAKVDFKEFNKQAIERWSRMSEADKEPYVERAKMLADHFKKIEVPYLRKRLRQLQQQVRIYRQQGVRLIRNNKNER